MFVKIDASMCIWGGGRNNGLQKENFRNKEISKEIMQ